ncbi:hypothetical protein C8255_11385, partial [filamentous cyanobacterium CCP3]
MDKIKEQANVVSQLLFSAETSDIYKKTLTRTWDILREVGILLWLVICLTFVGGEWFYRTAVGLGQQVGCTRLHCIQQSLTCRGNRLSIGGGIFFAEAGIPG